MDITELTQESLSRYYNALEYVGYAKIKDSERLLVLAYIEEFLSDPTVIYYINDDDDRAIDRALACLYGSNCYISFPKCINGSAFNIIPEEGPSPRITEDDIIRVTEPGDDRLRYLERN